MENQRGLNMYLNCLDLYVRWDYVYNLYRRLLYKHGIRGAFFKRGKSY